MRPIGREGGGGSAQRRQSMVSTIDCLVYTQSRPTCLQIALQDWETRLFTARRNARITSAVLATATPSVCLSFRPSVRHTPVLCQNDGT